MLTYFTIILRKRMILHEVLYTSSIYESSYATVSIHKTKLGAFKELQRRKRLKYDEWYNDRLLYGKFDDKFMEYEDFKIGTMLVKE